MRKWPKRVDWHEQNHHIIAAFSPSALLREINRYRRRHGGDLREGWEMRVAQRLCSVEEYADYCEGFDPLPTKKEKKAQQQVKHVGRQEIARFLQTVQKFISNGGKLVDQSLADKRAQICTTCPENIPIVGCMGCSGLVPKLLKATKGASTEYDNKLRGCGVCGCQLKAKVHLPDEVVGDDDLEFPEHCWMNNK